MRYTIKFFNVFLILLSVSAVYIFVKYQFVGTDSGYFLAIARDFYAGKAYFTELKTAYTPLGIIIMGMPYYFYQIPNYMLPQCINICFTMGCAFLVGSILYGLTQYKSLALCFSLWLFVILIDLGGGDVLLEPISLFFQLLCLQWYLKYKKTKTLKDLIYSGFALGLSFLSKQYGIFLLIPIMVDFLLSKEKLKNIFYFFTAVSVPVLIFGIYLTSNGASFYEVILYLSGKGVYFDVGIGTGTNSKLTDTLKEYRYFYLLFPLILGLILISILKKQIITKKTLFFYLTFFSSLMVLKFAFYNHYFIYVMPYLFILMGVILYHLQSKLTLSIVLLVLLMGGFFLTKRIYYSKERRSTTQKKEIIFAKTLLYHIPKNSAVYFYGLNSSYYYLCNYKTTDYVKLSYTFYNYFYPKTILESINKKEKYLVLNPESLQKLNGMLLNYKIKKIQINNNPIYIISK